MRARTSSREPTPRQLRHFVWAVAVILALLAWSPAGAAAVWPLQLTAALLFALGTVLPRLFRWPYVALVIIPLFALRLLGRARPRSAYGDPVPLGMRYGSPEAGAAQSLHPPATRADSGRPPHRV